MQTTRQCSSAKTNMSNLTKKKQPMTNSAPLDVDKRRDVEGDKLSNDLRKKNNGHKSHHFTS